MSRKNTKNRVLAMNLNHGPENYVNIISRKTLDVKKKSISLKLPEVNCNDVLDMHVR